MTSWPSASRTARVAAPISYPFFGDVLNNVEIIIAPEDVTVVSETVLTAGEDD